jgi:hypothetical protein
MPFFWGMAVEYIFERYRRGKSAAAKTPDHERLS